MGRLFGREARGAGWLPDPPVPPYPGAPIYAGGNTTYAVGGSLDRPMAVPTVWACIGLLANSVSMLPIEAFKTRPDGISMKIIPDPPLLAKPSAGVVQSEWVHQVMVSLLLRGNAYGKITSRDAHGYPASILLLNPDLVVVRQDPNTLEVTYKIGQDTRLYTPNEIWHCKGLTLPGGLCGLSPVAYAASTIGVDVGARNFADNFFSDTQIPKAVLESDQQIDQTQALTIKDRVKASMQNRDPMVLGAGLKFVPLAIKPEESQFLQTQQFSASQICKFFNVPPEMVGAESSNSMTYANVEQRSIDFLTYCVSFWLKRIEDSMYGLLEGTSFVRFDVAALLRTDAETTAAVHIQQIAAKVRTPTEVRAEMNLLPMTQEQKDEVNLVPLITNVIGGSKLGVKVNTSVEAAQNPTDANPGNPGKPAKVPKGSDKNS
jgi:HK97 family phage portal protein